VVVNFTILGIGEIKTMNTLFEYAVENGLDNLIENLSTGQMETQHLFPSSSELNNQQLSIRKSSPKFFTPERIGIAACAIFLVVLVRGPGWLKKKLAGSGTPTARQDLASLSTSTSETDIATFDQELESLIPSQAQSDAPSHPIPFEISKPLDALRCFDEEYDSVEQVIKLVGETGYVTQTVCANFTKTLSMLKIRFLYDLPYYDNTIIPPLSFNEAMEEL
jgi:hypothetical protein